MPNNIKSLIDSKGLKKSYVAEKAGISESHLRKITNGKSIPSLTVSRKIANALGESVEKVFPWLT